MRQHKRYITWSLTIFLLTFFAFFSIPSKTSAQSVSIEQSECFNGTVPFYDARFKPDPDTYDVFVKMGRRGQSAQTTLYIENAEVTDCQTVGTIQANGDAWQKIGTWTAAPNNAARFQLSSAGFDNIPDANRPTVMLVSATKTICAPTINCSFTFEGNKAYINPHGTLLSENSLHVTQVTDPKQDSLLHVDYYSDGKLLYTKPTLEAFDQRYLIGGNQTLSRVLQYKSKQQVVIQEQRYVSFAYDISNLFFRIMTSNKVGLQIIGILVALSIISLVVLAIIHALHRRHMWKLNHGLVIQKPTHEGSNASSTHILHADSRFIAVSKLAFPIILIISASLFLVTALDAYVVQLFRVDGVSMETTLQTDDKLLVNKIPKTWATVNQQEYIPKRGDVIVFHKAHSEQFAIEEGQEKAKETYVVKRVLGLPGERVTVIGDTLTVYNKEYPGGFVPDKNSKWKDTLQLGQQENLDVTLGSGEIFVSGDNRPESLDSRSNGPIQLSEIVGRANARVLPISKYQNL